MDDKTFLTERFEADRRHLTAVAYRMLGSTTDAEDALQEAWLRLQRADTSEVTNLTGWLTTVVARVCLDMLRSRRTRRQDPLDLDGAIDVTDGVDGVNGHNGGVNDTADPEEHAVLADSVGLALLVVLETLSPAERVAFVLHDMFGVPFEEVAEIVGRTPTAARQLASRARRRVQGVRAVPDSDFARRREIVEAFISASRGEGFDALIAVLDPDVVGHADAAARALGADPDAHGAGAVLSAVDRKARALRMALVDGVPTLVSAPGGRPRLVFFFTLRDGLVREIDIVADRDRIASMDLVLVDA
jgi:RNA polymerase sigma-70 factor (ECF subfamily)